VVDVLTPEQRQWCMARVKSKNTAPEIIVRRTLHALGYRFRLHRKDLPGSPDIVISKQRVVVFVHGCFWHGHARCHRANRPASNVDFWNEKLDANIRRDRITRHKLREMGWRILVVWECQARGTGLERRLASMLRREK
jgi:DNA mismatch endonuclease (patch repair protein)